MKFELKTHNKNVPDEDLLSDLKKTVEELRKDKGGETGFENLQTLCSVCNIGRSNLDFNV